MQTYSKLLNLILSTSLSLAYKLSIHAASSYSEIRTHLPPSISVFYPPVSLLPGASPSLYPDLRSIPLALSLSLSPPSRFLSLCTPQPTQPPHVTVTVSFTLWELSFNSIVQPEHTVTMINSPSTVRRYDHMRLLCYCVHVCM